MTVIAAIGKREGRQSQEDVMCKLSKVQICVKRGDLNS